MRIYISSKIIQLTATSVTYNVLLSTSDDPYSNASSNGVNNVLTVKKICMNKHD